MGDVEHLIPTAATFDEFVANATPAAVVQIVDGWLLRWNHGLTRRANSVLASGDRGRDDLAAKLRCAEEFYRQRGAPARFQITDATPPTVIALLDERGYTADAASLIQTATTDHVLAVTAHAPAHDVEVTREVTADWLALDDESGGHPQAGAIRRAMLERIGPRTVYALARVEGTPAAIALGVIERGWMGLYAVATLAQFRRRGASTAVLRALAQAARDDAAPNIYLAVMETNHAARTVYGRAGFITRYRYHYRDAPKEAGPAAQA